MAYYQLKMNRIMQSLSERVERRFFESGIWILHNQRILTKPSAQGRRLCPTGYHIASVGVTVLCISALLHCSPEFKEPIKNEWINLKTE